MVASFRCTGIGCRFAVGKCVIISYSEFLNVRHWSVVFFFSIYSLKMKHEIDALLMTEENSSFMLRAEKKRALLHERYSHLSFFVTFTLTT